MEMKSMRQMSQEQSRTCIPLRAVTCLVDHVVAAPVRMVVPRHACLDVALSAAVTIHTHGLFNGAGAMQVR